MRRITAIVSTFFRSTGGSLLATALGAQPVRKEFLSIVARHKASIANTLESGEVFTPVLLPDEDGVYRGNDWAGGFVRGMNFRKPEWTALFDDEDHGGSLVPILALAHEHDPDPEMRPYQGPVSAERRDDLIIGIAAGVMRIYKYFRRPVRRERSLVADASTYRRTLPKIGRNGMITLH
jgi:uncharacterized protein